MIALKAKLYIYIYSHYYVVREWNDGERGGPEIPRGAPGGLQESGSGNEEEISADQGGQSTFLYTIDSCVIYI